MKHSNFSPYREERPWGSFTVIQEELHFKVKRVVVLPHHALSLQRHRHRIEHWVILSGIARVINGEREFDLHVGQCAAIGRMVKHRLINNTDQPLELIEVQTGSYVGEDDIERFEDNYGRGEK